MGWRLAPARAGFEIKIDATRRAAANDDMLEHRIGVVITARW